MKKYTRPEILKEIADWINDTHCQSSGFTANLLAKENPLISLRCSSRTWEDLDLVSASLARQAEHRGEDANDNSKFECVRNLYFSSITLP